MASYDTNRYGDDNDEDAPSKPEDGTSVRENPSGEEGETSEQEEPEGEEEYAEIAFEEFPEDFKELVKNRLEALGKAGVSKERMGEVQTAEDVSVFEADTEQIKSLELILKTPVQQIPFHYVINTDESFDLLFFEYDVIRTILMAQHGKEVLPDDANDLSIEEFMKNLDKYRSYVLSDARSRSGVTPKDIMEQINLIQANSSGALQLDNTQFGDVAYMKFSNRVYGTQSESYEENVYRRINQFENTLRAYIGLFQNTYITTSQPLPDVMLEDANEIPEADSDTSPLGGPSAFQ